MIQNWSSGSHNVGAYYLGNARFNPSHAFIIQYVNSAPTKVDLISSENPSTYGQKISLTARVSSTDNLSPVGYVQFKVDGKIYGNLQLLPENGQVTINVTQLKIGTHQIEADYLGSENFTPSGASLTLQVIGAKQQKDLQPPTNDGGI